MEHLTGSRPSGRLAQWAEKAGHALVSISLKRPWLVIAVWVILAALASTQFGGLQVDNRIASWVSSANPLFKAYAERNRLFGDDMYIVAAYQDDSLFTSSGIALNRDLVAKLRAIEGVKTVTALTTVPLILNEGTILPPLDKFTADSATLGTLRREMETNEWYRHFLLSADGRKTAIIIGPGALIPGENIKLVSRIKDALAGRLGTRPFYLSGGAAIDAAYNDLSVKEARTFGLLCVGLIIIASVLYFRSLAGALVPLSCAIIAACVSMGIFALGRTPVTAVTIIMPLVVMIAATATSLHLVHAALRAGPYNDRWCESLTSVAAPGFLTGLTTAIGFLSFCITTVVPLFALGLFTAIGVMVAWAVCSTLGSAILRLLPQREPRTFNMLQSRIVPFSVQHRTPIFIASIVLLALMIAGMCRLSFQTDNIRQLSPRNPVRIAVDTMETWFEGIYPLDVIIKSRDGKALQTDEVIPYLQRLETAAARDPRTVKMLSPATFERLASAPAFTFAPQLAEEIRSMGVASDSAGLFAVIAADHSAARLNLWTRWMNNIKTKAYADSLLSWADASGLKKRFEVGVTGLSLMFVEIDRLLVWDQLSSFALCFLLVLAVFYFLTRSIRVALIALIPNVYPVALTMGTMGWAGISLDMSTVIIASITLGLSVDDTIHFVHGCNGDYSFTNMCRVMELKGPSIISTSLFISLGFLLLIPSQFVPLSRFGLFVALNALIAIISEAFLAPALLLRERGNS